MRALLSKQDHRYLDFLEFLMRHDPTPLSQISAQIGYPIRTLSADIKQINAYIAPARIVCHAQGLMLEIPRDSSVRSIYTQLLRNSREYKLLMYLFFHENEHTEKISKSLYISLSTLRRMSMTLNKCLQEKKIEICMSHHCIQGNEINITALYTSIFSELYYNNVNLMSRIERDVLTKLCKKMSREGYIRQNFKDFQRTLTWIYVRLIRMSNRHNIHSYKDFSQKFQTNILEDITFCQQFQNVFKLALDKDCLCDMFHPFLRWDYARTPENMENIAAESPMYLQLNKNIHTVLKRIAYDLELSLEGTETLMVDLFNMLGQKTVPIKGLTGVLYNRSKLFTDSFKREHTLVSATIRQHIKTHLDYDDELTDTVFYLIVSQWPNMTKRINNSMEEVLAGTLFDSDMDHIHLLHYLIKETLKIKLRFIVPTQKQTDNLDLFCQAIDLLITNIPGMDVPCSVVCIEDYPTERDKENILLEVKRIYQEKRYLKKPHSSS